MGSTTRSESEPDSEPEDADEPKQPRAADLFCGPNAPVALALEWCGWIMDRYYWILDVRHDLSKLEVQASIEAKADEDEALTVALPKTREHRIQAEVAGV